VAKIRQEVSILDSLYERLAEDMKTCLIYGKRAEFGRPECDIPMQLHQACDLPETCGYVIQWRKEGLI